MNAAVSVAAMAAARRAAKQAELDGRRRCTPARLRTAARLFLVRLLPPVVYAHVATWVLLRRPLRLRNPRTFSDLVQRRMLHERTPQLAWTCDKRAMKRHAAASGAVVRIPETLWFGEHLADLPGADLCGRWVLKRNGSSQLVHFGEGPVTPELLAELEAKFAEHRSPFEQGGEWAYSQADDGWLVERLLAEPPLPDYKVHVFHGRAVFTGVHHGRGTDDSHTCHYSRHWEPLAPIFKGAGGTPEPAPKELDALLDAAERVAAGFDFLRVDFYLIDGDVWFGETTPYPGQGRFISDVGFDRWLAELWLSGSHDGVIAREREIRRYVVPGEDPATSRRMTEAVVAANADGAAGADADAGAAPGAGAGMDGAAGAEASGGVDVVAGVEAGAGADGAAGAEAGGGVDVAAGVEAGAGAGSLVGADAEAGAAGRAAEGESVIPREVAESLPVAARDRFVA